ncbi:MAG: bifunctional oligoribonuclease/PAP phosphatase NrnA [Lachnospiraceae bacterium]
MQLTEQLQAHRTIAISGHVRPDGDCVGATLAVYNYIRTYFPEKEVDIYLEEIPHIFDFLTNSSQIKHTCDPKKVYDLFIVLDCGDAGRLGEFEPMFHLAEHTLCIDHHASNGSFAQTNYIFPDLSSTCELVFDVIEKEKITKEIAECIYVGLVHDTGVFQYACTSSKTMNIAGELMDIGIDYTGIIDRTFYTKTYEQNRVMGQALLDSRLCLDGRCIVSQITYAQMQKFHVRPKHLDGIVNQLQVTKDVEVAVFLYQTDPDSFKVSMRSKKLVNVADVAVKFGGGGHVRAAGATIKGDWKEIEEKVISEIAKQLQQEET